MSQIEKLVAKFLNNPTSLKYSQIEKILLNFNFKKIQAKGSHIKYKHNHLNKDLIIPIHNNDCKDFYKNLIAKYIKNII